MLGGDGTVQQQIRAAAEQAVEQGEWQSQDPNRTAQSVILAAALATHDSRTSGTLHPTTRQVLDRMWTFQREDGSWAWPIRCKWPPSEIDEYFGVALAALAVGMAPGDYRKTPQAVRGLEKIRGYLSRNRAATPYQRGMLLWASRQLDGVLADADEKATVQELLSLQRPDGGWSFASLGNWQRSDGKPQDTTTSDGYGTGFAIYLLRLAGLAEGHSQIQKGIEWLKTHQRQSGRWFTRSANKDNKHYITHEGTAFAMMALAACHQVPGGPQ
jgi:squalene-hopene/tetraprenyl-beta-curcumene cyclase